MHLNGVSHLTVESDVEGVAEIMRWLLCTQSERSAARVITCADPR